MWKNWSAVNIFQRHYTQPFQPKYPALSTGTGAARTVGIVVAANKVGTETEFDIVLHYKNS